MTEFCSSNNCANLATLKCNGYTTTKCCKKQEHECNKGLCNYHFATIEINDGGFNHKIHTPICKSCLQEYNKTLPKKWKYLNHPCLISSFYSFFIVVLIIFIFIGINRLLEKN